MEYKVPRGTYSSPSVISSSTINQGDLAGAMSSSSSNVAGTPEPMASAGSIPTLAHTTSPSRTTFIPSIYPNTNVYASKTEIQNCSSNVKTCSSTDCNQIAGYTKSTGMKALDGQQTAQDCTHLYSNANIDAIRPMGEGVEKEGKVSPVDTTDNTQLSTWFQTVEGPASNKGWGIPRGLGLRGGGENSLNAGTSGWGTPPAGAGAGWGGAAPQQWGAGRPPGPAPNANQPNPAGPDFNNQSKQTVGAPPGVAGPSTSNAGAGAVAGSSGQGGQSSGAPGGTSWAQAAGKGLPQGPAPTPNSTTKQIEQLNSMREALFAQDGWGGQHVNQDTTWDTPGSPEPAKGDTAGTSMWKQNVNNGTDLWEANLRNGGQPPAQPQNKTPWGHTPTTNIGGTWGEEDESNESSSVWTGGQGAGPVAPSAGAGAPWPGAPAGPWPDKKQEWGGPGAPPGAPAGQWGGNSGPAGPMQGPNGPADLNARDSNVNMQRNGLLRLGNDGSIRVGPPDGGVMRGDPRGVSGRLNNTDQMWAAHQPPPTPKLPGLPPVAGNQWSGGLPKDMGGMVNPGGKPSGWEEPSPPAQRRNIPNYDDGTSLWGQQSQPRMPQPAPGQAAAAAANKNNLAQWDKMGVNNMGRGGNMANMPGGMPGARMPTVGAAGSVKPDMAGPVWGQPRNGAWDHDPSAGWGDDSNKLAANWPGESPLTPPSWPGGKPAGKPVGWGEDAADGPWPPSNMPRPNMHNLSPEFIYSTKQFRALCEMNYKKEDVESALRSTNMNMQEAADLLLSWGRRDDHFDLRGSGFNPAQPLGFPGGPGGNGTNGAGLGLGKMNMMGQAGQIGQVGAQPGQARPGTTGQPTAQQLKMLIQQIQTAVQTGYLNHQILNQPLAPPTLMLVNQLLQQIKLLQQLNQRQQILNMSGQMRNPAVTAQLTMQINKCKQSIQSFQNQITGYQQTHIKEQQLRQQQQQQQSMVPPGDTTNDLFKSSFSDPLTSLPNFPDLSLSDKSMAFQTQAQSRLNQWKLPSLDKDAEGTGFSRAPGSDKTISSQLDTWSVGGRAESGWPDSTTGDLNDKDNQWSTQQTNSIADFIPEFEPGKPWKGTQMKTVEEDPSMTPGSVARSPLTMGSIKDSEMLTDSNKASPGPPGSNSQQDNSVLTSLGLSSSPWTTLSNSATSSVYTSPLSKLTSSKSWGETGVSQSTDVWGKTPGRGPPPGLGVVKIGQNQPNWSGGAGNRSSWASSSSSWGSPWLILRNLTPQIDGSTLKTLCMQHGPLQNFHLHLNVGTALAKYSSREEANKAQQALNNCVLGNTTIFAESPSEPEVTNLLNQLGHSNSQGVQQQQQQQQSNWNLRTSQAATAKSTDTWGSSTGALPGYGGSSNLWQSTGSSSSLWGSDADAHRSTPGGTPLNSYLPPDLLNGETM